MEFITDEVKSSLGLTDEQITGLTPVYQEHFATKQKEWDNKANENAEGILNGAISKIVETTKVPRNQGEKVADYIERAGNTHLVSLKTDLENAKLEYDKKLKDFKGDDATKAELEQSKALLDEAKKQLADYDVLKEKASKFEPLETEYKNMKLQIAFQGVKPNFPENVNPYESAKKWEDFVKGVQDKYIIELVDGEAICKDKENEYKIVKLKYLVEGDETIKSLTEGRKQTGTGAKQSSKKIEGMPFEVPDNISRSEIHKLIENHIIAKEGIKITDGSKYSKRFSELWSKIPQ